MSDEKKSHHKPKEIRILKTGQPIDAPPDYLGLVGKMCYQKIVQDLVDMGVADRADSRAVEAFATAYEEYRKARKICLDSGYTYETVVGNEVRIMKRPESEIMGNAWMRMRSLLSDLYLTPATRTKAPGIGKVAEKNEWDDLIPGV